MRLRASLRSCLRLSGGTAVPLGPAGDMRLRASLRSCLRLSGGTAVPLGPAGSVVTR